LSRQHAVRIAAIDQATTSTRVLVVASDSGAAKIPCATAGTGPGWPGRSGAGTS
jgi:glycerol kinase